MLRGDERDDAGSAKSAEFCPSMSTLPISVCMISGAEAHRIRPALASVADWTREIVMVLNEEVTDDTEKVGASFGARVFREPWKGFVGQKNSVAEKASQPWLLNIDADEVVPPPLAEEIRRAVSGSPAWPAAFEFPRCTFYCGRWIRHGDWYPDRVLRVWQRGRARWIGEEPHAYLQVDGPVGRLRSDLRHFSNESIARQISKIAPYQEGFVRQRAASGRPVHLFHLAGRPLWRFLRAYIVRRGFLDGWQGFYIASLSAFSTLTRYAMVRESAALQSRKP
jgi:glycosyltransferase involved in cell wall biosynthesis